MSPGLLAFEGFTWPAPIAKRSAVASFSSTICLPRLLTTSAVVMIADFIAAGDQFGCELLSNAAIPLRWGADMDVPEIMLKVEFESGNDPTWRGHPARTFTPGPMMSGFRIPGLGRLGPLDEKDATIGDRDVPKIVPLKMIVAVGERVELI